MFFHTMQLYNYFQLELEGHYYIPLTITDLHIHAMIATKKEYYEAWVIFENKIKNFEKFIKYFERILSKKTILFHIEEECDFIPKSTKFSEALKNTKFHGRMNDFYNYP